MTNNKLTDEQIAGLIEVLSGVGRPDNLTVRALRELQEYRKAAPVVPDEIAISGSMDFGEQCYADGWNKCRFEILNKKVIKQQSSK
ncbi:MAG TPA: hypothetical protein VGN40_07840 [Lelliottia sp.]|jgi:hypothetical protein